MLIYPGFYRFGTSIDSGVYQFIRVSGYGDVGFTSSQKRCLKMYDCELRWTHASWSDNKGKTISEINLTGFDGYSLLIDGDLVFEATLLKPLPENEKCEADSVVNVGESDDISAIVEAVKTVLSNNQ